MKYEYSPNNNTNQNIELYKQKSSFHQNLPMNYGYSNLNYPDQVNYNNIYNNGNLPVPFASVKNKNQFYMQQVDYTSPQYQMDLKQNYINNNNNDNNNNNNINIKDNNDSNKINNSTENIINTTKDIINNNINNKDDKAENVEDPYEYMFKDQDEKDKDNSKKDEESELSDESEKNSDNENEYNDHLLAQYQKVKRVKNKWKVTFIGCVVQKDNKEYICGKIHGELEREW